MNYRLYYAGLAAQVAASSVPPHPPRADFSAAQWRAHTISDALRLMACGRTHIDVTGSAASDDQRVVTFVVRARLHHRTPACPAAGYPGLSVEVKVTAGTNELTVKNYGVTTVCTESLLSSDMVIRVGYAIIGLCIDPGREQPRPQTIRRLVRSAVVASLAADVDYERSAVSPPPGYGL